MEPIERLWGRIVVVAVIAGGLLLVSLLLIERTCRRGYGRETNFREQCSWLLILLLIVACMPYAVAADRLDEWRKTEEK
jgi:hypothetical protein